MEHWSGCFTVTRDQGLPYWDARSVLPTEIVPELAVFSYYPLLKSILDSVDLVAIKRKINSWRTHLLLWAQICLIRNRLPLEIQPPK